MQITHNINLPPTYGKIVETYLQTLEREFSYSAFTVSDDLQIIGVKGKIENNGRVHYHHNYDNSEDELFIIYIASGKKRKTLVDNRIRRSPSRPRQKHQRMGNQTKSRTQKI